MDMGRRDISFAIMLRAWNTPSGNGARWESFPTGLSAVTNGDGFAMKSVV